jgi:stage V sporulation protein G
MEITEVQIIPADGDRLKAYVTITIDNCFVISELKVIRGPKGYFVDMPKRKRTGGDYLDIVFPLNDETRKMLEERILAEYKKIIGEPVKRRVLEIK